MKKRIAMNMNSLLYFRVLARHEHYGRAALELYISQPSLSHAIASLEKLLGTKLFEKQGRNVVLTKYGKQFAQNVEKGFYELDLGEENLRKLTSSGCGRIDLAFFQTLGVYFIPYLIRDFKQAPPNRDVTFSLTQDNTDGIIQGLQSGRYDIGFCSSINHDKYPEIETIPVARQRIGFIVPKGHPLANQTRISLACAARYPFIAFSRDSGLRPVIDGILGNAGITPNILYEADQGNCVAGLVSAGFGISIIPEIPLPELDILFIPPEENVPPRKIFIAKTRERYITEPAENFKNFVLEKYRGINFLPNYNSQVGKISHNNDA